jgi:hypothetical protein
LFFVVGDVELLVDKKLQGLGVSLSGAVVESGRVAMQLSDRGVAGQPGEELFAGGETNGVSVIAAHGSHDLIGDGFDSGPS